VSTKHRIRARHGSRVIDQSGHLLEDTGRFPRLAYVLGRHPEPVPEAEVTLPLPITRDPRLAPTTVPSRRMLPVAGDRTVGWRVAERRPVRPRNLFETPEIRAIGRAAGEADDAWVKARRAEDAAWSGILLRLDRVAERVRSWTIAGADEDLALAYAEGGTEKLLKLTPEVLARLDAAKATAGSAVSA